MYYSRARYHVLGLQTVQNIVAVLLTNPDGRQKKYLAGTLNNLKDKIH